MLKIIILYIGCVKYVGLLCIFIAGILFRLLIIRLVPQPLIMDQELYVALAHYMKQIPMYTDTIHTYGYPGFIALIFGLFGSGNLAAVYLAQVLLDSITAILVFLIARKIFAHKLAAWIACILYAFNPFTSAYTGVVLTETLTVFLTALSFYLFLLATNTKNLIAVFAVSLVLGFIPQVRPSLFIFALITIIMLIIKIVHSKTGLFVRLAMSVYVFALFFLPSVYTLLGNSLNYKTLSILPVDNLFLENTYISMLIERGFPLSVTPSIPKEVVWTFSAFTGRKDSIERQRIQTLFTNLVIEKIKENPLRFVTGRLKKMWYIWEKHYIYPYQTEPIIPFLQVAVYTSNLILLILALIGFGTTYRSGRTHKSKIFYLVTVIFFLHLSLIHSFTSAEERYSILAYPLIYIFGGYTLSIVVSQLRGVLMRKTKN